MDWILSYPTIKKSFEFSLAGLSTAKNAIFNRISSIWKRNEKFLLLFSKNLLIDAVPRIVKPVALTAISFFNHYHKINLAIEEVFKAPEPMHVEGLDPEIEKEFIQNLNSSISAIIGSKFASQFVTEDKIENLKTKLIQNILKVVFEKIPIELRQKITLSQIKNGLSNGFLKALKDYAFSHPAKLEDWIKSNLNIAPELENTLKNLQLSFSSPAGFFFDFAPSSNSPSYTLRLYSTDSAFKQTDLNSGGINQMIFEFSNLSQEKVLSLFQYIRDLKDKKEGLFEYRPVDVPNAIQHFLDSPYEIIQIAQLNERFSGKFSYFHQKAFSEVFEENNHDQETFFLSMEVAEICVGLKNPDTLKSVDDCQRQIKSLRSLKQKLESKTHWHNKKCFLDTLEQAEAFLQAKLAELIALDSQEKTDDLKFPPLLWKIVDDLTQFSGNNQIYLEKIFLGIEQALGSQHQNFITHLKNEYTLFKGDTLVKPAKQNNFYRISVFLVGVILQFALIDVIRAALGIIFVPVSFLSKSFFNTSTNFFELELKNYLPKELWNTYESVWAEIISSMIPLAMKLYYKYLVDDEVKKEIDFRIELLDSLTLKSDYLDLKPEVEEPTQVEESKLLPITLQIEQRLKVSRKEFVDRVEKAIQLQQENDIEVDYGDSLWPIFRNSSLSPNYQDKVEVWKALLEEGQDHSGISHTKKNQLLSLLREFSHLTSEVPQTEIRSFSVELGVVERPKFIENFLGLSEASNLENSLSAVGLLNPSSIPQVVKSQENSLIVKEPIPISLVNHPVDENRNLLNPQMKIIERRFHFYEGELVEDLYVNGNLEQLGIDRFFGDVIPTFGRSAENSKVSFDFIRGVQREFLEKLPSIKIENADDFFNYCDQFYAALANQTSYWLPRWHSEEVKTFLKNSILDFIEKGITFHPFFYIDPNDSKFLDVDFGWSAQHTLKLCNNILRIIQFLGFVTTGYQINQSPKELNSVKYSIDNISPKTALILANLQYLAEKRLEKEVPGYRFIGCYEAAFYWLRNCFSIGGCFVEKEFQVLKRLLEEFVRQNPDFRDYKYNWNFTPLGLKINILGSQLSVIKNLCNETDPSISCFRVYLSSKKTTSLKQPLRDLMFSQYIMRERQYQTPQVKDLVYLLKNRELAVADLLKKDRITNSFKFRPMSDFLLGTDTAEYRLDYIFHSLSGSEGLIENCIYKLKKYQTSESDEVFKKLFLKNFPYFTNQLLYNRELIDQLDALSNGFLKSLASVLLNKKKNIENQFDCVILLFCNYYFPEKFPATEEEINLWIKEYFINRHEFTDLPLELRERYLLLDAKTLKFFIPPKTTTSSFNELKQIQPPLQAIQPSIQEVPCDENVPAIFYPLIGEREMRYYKTPFGKKILEIGLKSDKNGFCKFIIEEDKIECLAPIRGKVLKANLVREKEILGHHIIIENAGNYYALYKARPWGLDIIRRCSNSKLKSLDKTFSFLAGLFPSYEDSLKEWEGNQLDSGFSIIQIGQDGSILPASYAQYSQLLIYYYLQDPQKASFWMKELCRHIDLGLMKGDEFHFEYILMILLVVENAFGDVHRRNDLMFLALTWLQKNEIDGAIKKNQNAYIILIGLYPIYLRYIQNKEFLVNPIPVGLEALFLMASIDCILSSDHLKTNQIVKQIAEIFGPGILFSIFTLFASEEFCKRLKGIDQHFYHGKFSQFQRMCYRLSLIAEGGRLGAFMGSGAYALIPRFDHFIPEGAYSSFMTALAYRSLSNLPWAEFKDKDLKHSSNTLYPIEKIQLIQEQDVRENFLFFASLFAFPSSKIAINYGISVSQAELYIETLRAKLTSAFIPETSHYQALYLLKHLCEESVKPAFVVFRNQEDLIDDLISKKHSLFSIKKIIKKTGIEFLKDAKRTFKVFPKKMTSPAYFQRLRSLGLSIGLPILDYSSRVVEHIFPLEDKTAEVFFDRSRSFSNYVSQNPLKEELKSLKLEFDQLGMAYFEKEEKVDPPKLKFEVDSFSSYYEDRVQKSLNQLEKELSEVVKYRLKSDATLDSLKEQLLVLQKSFKEQIEAFTNEIERIANRKTFIFKSKEALYSIVLEKDAVEILKSQGNLVESEALLIIRRITLLALYETYLTKINLCLEEIATQDPDKVAFKIFEPKYYSLEEGNLRYTLGCLIFEAKNKVWLRPLQAAQMEKACKNEEESLVIEMIPGSGKTAFGIVLDLHHRWKKGALSIAIFTQQLITSTKKDLADRFYRMTGRKAFCLNIERGKESVSSLKFLLGRIKIAQEVGDVVIATKEELQTIQLLYIENKIALSKLGFFSKTPKEISDKVDLLKELLEIFSETTAIADECHEILRSDIVLKHPIGQKKQLNHLSVLGVELVFKHLILLLKQNNISFDTYLLRQDVDLSRLLSSILEDDFFQIGREKKEALREYLLNLEKSVPEWLEKSQIFETVATIRGVLHDLLPDALKEKVYSSYGLSKENLTCFFAIPYSGNNTPMEDSIFESPLESLVKTYLIFLSMPNEVFSPYVQLLYEKIELEIENQIKNQSIDRKETQFGKLNIQIFGTDNPSLEEMQRLESQEKKVIFVTLLAAQQINFFEEAVESNAMDFHSLFKKVDYFSGTIYNKSLYPQDVRHVRSLDTTAKTINIIAQKMEESGQIRAIHSQEEYLEQLVADVDCQMAIDAGALFNGVDNETVARKIGKKLKARRPDIKAVLFFNKENQLQFFDVKNFNLMPYDPQAFKPEERFCYLDQIHTFGVDIPQKAGAKSNITVDDNSLADIEQAVWRLRGLETQNQSVNFSILPKAKIKMDESGLLLNSQGLIRYLVEKEEEKLKPQNLQSREQKIKNIVRAKILSKLFQSDTSLIPNEFMDLFVKGSCSSGINMFGRSKKLMRLEEVLGDDLLKWKKRVQSSSFFDDDEKTEILQKMSVLSLSNIPKEFKVFPQQIRNADHFFGNKSRLRLNQTERQQQKTQEKLFNKVENVIPQNRTKLIPFQQMKINLQNPRKSFPDFTLKSLSELMNEMHGYQNGLPKAIFKDSMLVSKNIILFSENNLNRIELCKSRRPVESILIVYEKKSKKFSTIALSHLENILWLDQLSQTSSNQDYLFGICTLSLGTLYFRDRMDPVIESYYKGKEFQEQLYLWRIFTCCSSIDKLDFTPWRDFEPSEVIEFLENWWVEKGIKAPEFLSTLKVIYNPLKKSTSFI